MASADAQRHEEGFFLEHFGAGVREDLRACEAGAGSDARAGEGVGLSVVIRICVQRTPDKSPAYQRRADPEIRNRIPQGCLRLTRYSSDYSTGFSSNTDLPPNAWEKRL